MDGKNCLSIISIYEDRSIYILYVYIGIYLYPKSMSFWGTKNAPNKCIFRCKLGVPQNGCFGGICPKRIEKVTQNSHFPAFFHVRTQNRVKRQKWGTPIYSEKYIY